MISCFISIFCHISNPGFKQLSLVACGKTHTTKSATELVSLLIVLILCGLCRGGFEQAKILIKGVIIYFRIRGSWESRGLQTYSFLKIGGHKNDKEIVWWLQYSKFCSMK